MDRRTITKAGLSVAAAVFATGRAEAAPNDSAIPKVVYHLADLDKVAFVLGNIANHYEGMGGPLKVTLALVVHGPALKAFHIAGGDAGLAPRFAQLVKEGLEAATCIHTMKAQKVALTDLLPGFVVAERGGVVRLAELQAQGYAYLRP